nr:MAG TPA: hypothetical protein [Caudoviricetes sp.]
MRESNPRPNNNPIDLTVNFFNFFKKELLLLIRISYLVGNPYPSPDLSINTWLTVV